METLLTIFPDSAEFECPFAPSGGPAESLPPFHRIAHLVIFPMFFYSLAGTLIMCQIGCNNHTASTGRWLTSLDRLALIVALAIDLGGAEKNDPHVRDLLYAQARRDGYSIAEIIRKTEMPEPTTRTTSASTKVSKTPSSTSATGLRASYWTSPQASADASGMPRERRGCSCRSAPC